MTTIYYSPEDYGLDVVGSIEQPDLDYEFHILSVWQHQETRRIFWGVSSGCSCPSPFDEYYFRGPDDTNLETDLSVLKEAIQAFPGADDDKARLQGWLDAAILKRVNS